MSYRIVKRFSMILFVVGIVLSLFTYNISRYAFNASLNNSLGLAASALFISLIAVVGNHEVRKESKER